MHWVFRVLFFVLLCATVSAQTATVDKTILDPGTPNLFFESISLAWNERTGLTLMTWERHPGTSGPFNFFKKTHAKRKSQRIDKDVDQRHKYV